MLRISAVLLRVWITPGPHKGWNPENFQHMGKAMKLARMSKHITYGKLSFGTGISKIRLRLIERGLCLPTPEQQKVIERWLGVPLAKQRKSYIDRAI